MHPDSDLGIKIAPDGVASTTYQNVRIMNAHIEPFYDDSPWWGECQLKGNLSTLSPHCKAVTDYVNIPWACGSNPGVLFQLQDLLTFSVGEDRVDSARNCGVI